MKVNCYCLRSSLNKNDKELDKSSSNFIEEINNELYQDDLIIERNAKDPLFDVVLIESGGSEMEFKKLYRKLKNPVLLLSNCKNNSLAACFEIKTFLINHQMQCLILHGEEKNIASMISHIGRVYSTLNSINNTNLGVIGKPSDWLIGSEVDYGKVKSKLNINIIEIGIDELNSEINKKETGKVPHLSKLQLKFKDKDVLTDALYIYGALSRLVKKYRLKGLTIRCFDLLSEYKNTACLALALLNESEVTACCEGDVASLLTMYLIYVYTGRNPFQANPSYIDIAKNEILFAHCTVPLNMLSKYELTTHFESGLGVAVKGEMFIQEVDVVKINPDLENLTYFRGKIEENCSLPNYCRTQVKIKFEPHELIKLYQDPFGNHMIISYDRVIDDLLALLDFVND